MIVSPSPSNLFLPSLSKSNDQAAFHAEEQVQSNEEPEYVAFFPEALRIVELLGNVIRTFYHDGDRPPTTRGLFRHDPRHGMESSAGNKQMRMIEPHDFQAPLELDGTTVAWHERLPPHLRANPKSEKPKVTGDSSIHARQANILYVR